MAVLPELDRARALIGLMRDGSFGAVTKADLRAAVDATDAWIDSNAASYNVSIPQPARNALTPAQKTLLFCFVAMRRAGLLRVQEDG